jgi:predicted nicotinamide N-methyase
MAAFDDPAKLIELFPSLRLSSANQLPEVSESGNARDILEQSEAAYSATFDHLPTGDWFAETAIEPITTISISPHARAPIPAYQSTRDSNLVLNVVVDPQAGIAFQLWPAAHVMCRWLESQPTSFLSGKKIIELGAGCGLVGLLCASNAFDASMVTITDLPNVIPHINANIDANVGVFLSRDKVNAAALAWGQEDTWKHDFPTGSYDIILLSDCLYWESLFEPLLKTLLQLTNAETTVLMCQRHRWMHSGTLCIQFSTISFRPHNLILCIVRASLFQASPKIFQLPNCWRVEISARPAEI